LEVQLMLML